ncbi:murein hydrolase activator EnvC family protein [Undibacterium luofuense]|uniref:Peptidoglycan DD-metalloendopeptidase family protein n=1 Tax=Undibacterium luofuense TaxID=2828733 RepID=A0A941DMG5_9BURK|nr:peptidoglycan DD-metalloendopeptidase family protein [Undibacterium luofuense]MBR7782227.1 peptidoglycan DD-metalloendopeptidase family protein [Undibacterium luofuense]
MRSLILCLSLAGAVSAALAASPSRTQQKARAEADRAELQQQLKALKADISKTENAKDHAADALAESERAVSEANRSLRDLQSEQADTETRLQQLYAKRAALEAEVEKQKQRLSGFLKRQYMHGDSDRMKLLLSGDNPNRINRDLQYMGYVSQTQAKMIDGLRSSLKAVEQNTLETQQVKTELDEITEEEKEHKAALEREKKKHATLVTQLSDKLYTQRRQADNLQKDEQRLTQLVGKLNQLIEEQIKAEKARAEREEKLRQERLAAQKEKERLAELERRKNATRPSEGNKPAPSKPIKPAEPEEPVREVRSSIPAAGEFDKLKGQMRLPVRGDILAKFGSRRGDGPTWKGLFIKAPEGSEVRAVAPGKVIFADWYKGYGNMVIVGHGDKYMSIYGNNQSVLKHVGDTVKAGDVIASAGSSGANEESGLYFEIRREGRAFDPLNWISVK